MWLSFKKSICIALLALPLIGLGQNNDGLLYNLKQNWVQYDTEAKSFMPAISQSKGKAISFLLDGKAFKEQILYINNSKKVYLFYNQVLLSELSEGQHYFKVDSLVNIIKSNQPILTLYGKDVKSGLTTLIIIKNYIPSPRSNENVFLKDKGYSSFFIMVSILLLGSLIFIKNNSHDLFSQYANISRAFNFTTVDETIYKGSFFINPSVQLITWMSFGASFVFYYLITTLHIHFLEIDFINQNSLLYHIVHWVIFAAGFFVLYIIRYLLISVLASVFDMSSIRNIHFATHLRLSFYLLLVLQVLITLAYFTVIPFSALLILVITLAALFAIIVLTGIRLSFIIRHPFIQIFLYLCGTEIFLFVFVFMLVVG